MANDADAVEMTDLDGSRAGADNSRSFSGRMKDVYRQVSAHNLRLKTGHVIGASGVSQVQLTDVHGQSPAVQYVESDDEDDSEEHHGPNFKDTLFLSLLGIQTALVILFGVFTEYATGLDGRDTTTTPEKQVEEFTAVYPMFQDVHIMMFIGFAYLMTFLRRYGYSAIGYNMAIAALAIQWSIITRNVTEQLWEADNTSWKSFWDSFHLFDLDISTMVNADFAAATVLISFGGVLGKTTLVQLVWMVMFELMVYSCNEQLVIHTFGAADVGGSMVIHTFGAYFGLAVSYMITPRDLTEQKHDYDNRPVYHSDMFSMIGTIFLWCYWPSFNSALAGFGANAQPRTALNTFLSLTAAVLVVFGVNKVFRHGRLEMVDIQNATLAGGVAIGASANMMLRPWICLIIGALAGFVSNFGFAYITPYLWRRWRLHDTCGIHNLHAMPGVLGGLVAVIAAAGIDDSAYGPNVAVMFPKRGDGRTHSQQAWFQLAALVCTLGMAITSGVITGWILKSRLFKQPTKFFSDAEEWATPPHEIPYYLSRRVLRGNAVGKGSSLTRSSTVENIYRAGSTDSLA